MNPFVMHNREDTYHTPSDRATATSTGTSTPTSVSTHSVHGYGNGYGNGYSYGTGNTPRSAPAQNGTLFDSIEDSIKAFGEFQPSFLCGKNFFFLFFFFLFLNKIH